MTKSKYIDELTKCLKKDEVYVVEKYDELRQSEGNNSKHGLQSLRNTIGSKNNTFIDSVHMQFENFDDYLRSWCEGLEKCYGNHIVYGTTSQRYIVFELLKDEKCKQYIRTYLERSYYQNIVSFQREKPEEKFWEVWFGKNTNPWGLLIAPTKRNNKWENDVSEIRHAKFQYWTVGHILATGLINAKDDSIVSFPTVSAFMDFYSCTLANESSSNYEKDIMKEYLEYLCKSKDVETEPLLIPEFRFGGSDFFHRHRMDFAIFNIYVRNYIGIELSPSYTHMNSRLIKDEVINGGLTRLWGKEMNKRNNYFLRYDMPTITFTDTQLRNIKECFLTIQHYLQLRGKPQVDDDILRKYFG